MSCPFCNLTSDRIKESNEYALLLHDLYPVSEGHSLIIPKRHVSSYFELLKEELLAMNELLLQRQKQLEKQGVNDFNIGVNIGEYAGQTVYHCHIHLIPRRKGDVEQPRGGVRGVITSKQGYNIDEKA